jgi:hypothetical protein
MPWAWSCSCSRVRAPAGGKVDHPQERPVIIGIRDEPQVGERVLHFLALEKPQAAVDPIRHRRGEQGVFEHAGLGVGAIEQRDIHERNALVAQRLDLVDDECGLIRVGRGLVQAQGLTRALRGPEVLAKAHPVLPDQGVGGVENVAHRAIVLLELDHLAHREVAFEVLHVRRTSAAKGIDRLVVVAYREHRVDASRKQPQPLVLKPVRVLELVDQNVPEARAVMLAEQIIPGQQLEGAQQQLGEIHCAFAATEFFVDVIDLEQFTTVVIRRLHGGRPQPFFLVRVDEMLDLARRVLLVVDVQALHQPLHERELVLAVHDGEQLLQARLAMVGAQQSVAQAVESADPHAPGIDRQHG